MMNLLPPEEKSKLLLEKKKKMTIIFWFLVLFFIFFAILALLSIKTYLQIEIGSEKILLEQSNQDFNQKEIKSFKEKVEIANSNLEKLNSFYQKKVYFSDILENISKILPQQVFLTSLSIIPSSDEGEGNKKDKKGEENPSVKISLSGFSPTREVLFGLRKKLEEDNYFEEIYFSPSDWVKPTDINFSITFKVKK